MDGKSYYDVALNDLRFLEFCYENLDEAPNYNNILVQEQQVAEKLLKHLLDVTVDSDDAIVLLKSHKLQNILRRLAKQFDCILSMDDMRFLSDFYFDGRYPSNDYVFAEKEDAVRGFKIVQNVKQWVDEVLTSEQLIKRLQAF